MTVLSSHPSRQGNRRGVLVASPHIALLITLVTCAGIRAALLASSVTRLDSDQAVTGIMAHDILAGHFYSFYAGQHYMGALEQYLQAIFVSVFSTSAAALKVTDLLLAVMTCAFVYGVGRRCFDSQWKAILAAGLYAIGPYYNLLFGAKCGGAYAAGELLGIAALYFALSIDRTQVGVSWLAFVLGLTVGLGFWEIWTSALLIIPAIVWALGSVRQNERQFALLGGAGFLLGAAPVIVFLARHGVLPTPFVHSLPPSTIFERANTLTDSILPMLAGLKFANGSAVFDWLPSSLLMVGLFIAFGISVWNRRRGIVALVVARRGDRRPIDAVLLAFLLVPFLWLPSEYAFFGGEPRYLITLMPAFAIGLTALVPSTPRHGFVVGLLLLAGVALLSGFTVRRAIRQGGGGGVVAGVIVKTEPVQRVVKMLEQQRIHSVYADYWVAYVLQFFAEDRLSVAPTYASRFADRTAKVDHDPRPAYVVTEGPPSDDLAAKLRQANVRYRRIRTDGYGIFFELAPVARPAQLGLP
jgi:hypothetical protein